MMIATHPESGLQLYGGWLRMPHEVNRILGTLPIPRFEDAAPHLKGTGVGQDVFFWEAEQAVLGKILPSWDQGQIGSCVSHGWGRAVQDLLLIQIAAGTFEGWIGEVAREPIYGGSRVQVGGQRDYSDGSVGAWAAKWVNEWGIVLYAPGQLDGYYNVQRCKQWGHDGVPDNFQQMAKLHPAKTVSQVTTPEGARDATCNLFPVAICGETSRPMKRSPGGWCPKTGNNWPHCECIRGHCVVAGGPSSPFGGDGAFPYAGDTPAFCEQNSWGDYLGSDNNQVKLASGRVIELPQGVYLSRYEDRQSDLQEGDTFAASHAVGFPAQTIPWIIK